MPRFIRSIWSKQARKASNSNAASNDTPEILENMERLKEADFVRDFQKRLGNDNPVTANNDAEPGTTNIFTPTGEKSPD